MIGRSNARRGARRIFAVLQNRRLNQHIAYTVLDEVSPQSFQFFEYILNLDRFLLRSSRKQQQCLNRAREGWFYHASQCITFLYTTMFVEGFNLLQIYSYLFGGTISHDGPSSCTSICKSEFGGLLCVERSVSEDIGADGSTSVPSLDSTASVWSFNSTLSLFGGR